MKEGLEVLIRAQTPRATITKHLASSHMRDDTAWIVRVARRGVGRLFVRCNGLRCGLFFVVEEGASSMRVLVVEGEPAVRHLIDRVLTQRGHFVLRAPTMFEAMALTLDFPEPIHLALLDVLTPGMGGLAYADYLKRQFPSILVVLMIAKDDVLKVPPTAPLLFKPFTPEALMSVAERAAAPPPRASQSPSPR